MKRIIDIDEDYYEMLKFNVESGQKYKPWEIITNSKPYKEQSKKEIVPVCKVNFDKEQLQEMVDKKVAEMIEQPQGEWIPVSERLPDKEEYIQCNGLFIVSDGNRVYAEHFDIYDKKCFGEPTIYGFTADRLVIAWQPLPEPYKQG